MIRTLMVTGVVFMLTVGAATARAERGSSSVVDHAREIFGVGVEAFSAGDYQAALDAFTTSYELNPVSSLLYNIAMCQRALVRYLDSIDTFERYLREAGDRAPPERRHEVEGLIHEMEGLIGHLRLRVTPSEAIIGVDGQPPRPMPDGTLRVRAGQHTVTVSAPGYRDSVRTVEVGLRGVTELTVELESEEGPTEPTVVRPWYRRWWVWTIVGGVVVTGVAVGLGVGLTQDNTQSRWEVTLP